MNLDKESPMKTIDKLHGSCRQFKAEEEARSFDAGTLVSIVTKL